MVWTVVLPAAAFGYGITALLVAVLVFATQREPKRAGGDGTT